MLHISHGSPPDSYYLTRYRVLREPLGMSIGSERLVDDLEAYHAWIEHDGQVVAVGRAHIISENSDGSGQDHAGPDASFIPAFGPLATSMVPRPVFQIRQMGTLPSVQRLGFASRILEELEETMSNLGAKTGFLQARLLAIPFYESQGWICIDEPYEILGVGPHRSMMKQLN